MSGAATSPARDPDDADKRFPNLRARCALAGHELHRIDMGAGQHAYLISRWNLTRQLPDLDAVAAFLAQVGAA